MINLVGWAGKPAPVYLIYMKCAVYNLYQFSMKMHLILKNVDVQGLAAGYRQERQERQGREK
ncbi:hypothetical protein NIES4103_60740 [Nostoc sp. NIES-4103]|nr:hypothetical protein NIES4103_60740 [Nostoc sp. NIES-4103]